MIRRDLAYKELSQKFLEVHAIFLLTKRNAYYKLWKILRLLYQVEFLTKKSITIKKMLAKFMSFDILNVEWSHEGRFQEQLRSLIEWRQKMVRRVIFILAAMIPIELFLLLMALLAIAEDSGL